MVAFNLSNETVVELLFLTLQILEFNNVLLLFCNVIAQSSPEKFIPKSDDVCGILFSFKDNKPTEGLITALTLSFRIVMVSA